MGQYYCGVILDTSFQEKNEVIVKKAFSPYAHKHGSKLMEHSYITNWYVREYEHALATDCFGYPLVWAGDYADEISGKSLYVEAWAYIEEMEETNKADCVTAYENLPEYKYILNLDKKEYVKIEEVANDDYTIHPLPLLCAYGNGRSHSDYRGTNMKQVGIWAFDRLGVSNEIPNDYTEIVVHFKMR